MNKWYAASIIIYTRLKDSIQKKIPVWENVVLFKANSYEEALEKAIKCGKEQEGDSDNTHNLNGKPAKWVFGGVRKIIECVDSENQPGDGIEVTYSRFEVNSEEELQRLINGDSVKLKYEE